MIEMKVGDLVKVSVFPLQKKVGVITYISEPTPMFAYQTVTVLCDNEYWSGIAANSVVVISEK